VSTYAIGDIQGCFDELIALLDVIQFNSDIDALWFAGDLVNRGPKSLDTLRFIKNLKNSIVVLGNHDLHLLALYNDPELYYKHTMQAIIDAPDLDELMTWLRAQPLIHHDSALNFTMVHAGLYPQWSLKQALLFSEEVSNVLTSNQFPEFMENMYGDEPDTWNDNLKGWSRLRFIVNAFTRMRFITTDGKLEFKHQDKPGTQPNGFIPWFEIENRITSDEQILFGHWASLGIDIKHKNIFPLDGGCVWGNQLCALRLEDKKRFFVEAMGKTIRN